MPKIPAVIARQAGDRGGPNATKTTFAADDISAGHININ